MTATTKVQKSNIEEAPDTLTSEDVVHAIVGDKVRDAAVLTAGETIGLSVDFGGTVRVANVTASNIGSTLKYGSAMGHDTSDAKFKSEQHKVGLHGSSSMVGELSSVTASIAGMSVKLSQKVSAIDESDPYRNEMPNGFHSDEFSLYVENSGTVTGTGKARVSITPKGERAQRSHSLPVGATSGPIEQGVWEPTSEGRAIINAANKGATVYRDRKGDEQPLPDTVPGTVRYRRQKVNGAGLPVWKVSVSGCRSLQKVTAVAPVATTAATAYDMLD